MLEAPLGLGASGAGVWVALGALGLSLLSLVLSVVIAGVLVRGYRRGPGHTGMLVLAFGLLFLTTIPGVLRIGLPTATGVGTVGRSVLVSGCELLGLGVILYAVYRRGGET
jgi:hypothetical protein